MQNLFSHVWLCDAMDCSLPNSSVHGILQARILEWVATPSSRESSSPGIKLRYPVSPALQVDSLLLSHQGSPILVAVCHQLLSKKAIKHLFYISTAAWIVTLAFPNWNPTFLITFPASLQTCDRFCQSDAPLWVSDSYVSHIRKPARYMASNLLEHREARAGSLWGWQQWRPFVLYRYTERHLEWSRVWCTILSIPQYRLWQT